MNFQEKKDLFKVRQTVLEMISDRGYVIPGHMLSISFEQFSVQYDNKNIDLYIEDASKEKKYYVYFHTDMSFGKNDMKNVVQKIINQYQNDNIGIIILLKDKENTSIQKEKGKPMYKNVEFFEQRKMTFNITKHVFVPRHVIMTPEEETQVTEKYETPKSKFPKISVSDPVAKYYGMKPDQMCKIIRNDPEVGLSISYRIVK
jgi:DNA-directed RNA polymerase I, II, and III subunit RPABC1